LASNACSLAAFLAFAPAPMAVRSSCTDLADPTRQP
jgi:hypothetical protein